MDQDDWASAWTYQEQALRIRREIGDKWGEGYSLQGLGDTLLRQGEYAGALDYLERCLCISREISDRQGTSLALEKLGLLFHYLGDHKTAREYSQQALNIAEESARLEQARALTCLGHALAGLGHLAEAADAYRRALDLHRELGQHNLAMEPLAGMARVCLAQEDLAQAQSHVTEILGHLKTATLDGTYEPVRVYLTCYHVLRAGKDPRAQDILTAAYNFLQERAAKTSNEEMRRSFLENVSSHCELLAEWAKQSGKRVP